MYLKQVSTDVSLPIKKDSKSTRGKKGTFHDKPGSVFNHTHVYVCVCLCVCVCVQACDLKVRCEMVVNGSGK